MALIPSKDPVVIVGAGPIGLVLACELGMRDIPVIVFDERQNLLRHPKANSHTARSMEIYRKQGISRRLRDSGLPVDRKTDVAYFTRLYGRELYRVSLPSPKQAEANRDDVRWPTPEPQFRTTQMVLEPLLLERAQSYPSVEVRFGWRAAALEQDASGVDLTVENVGDGDRQKVRSCYLVGCDGGKSFVRRSLGLRFLGEGGLEMEFFGGRMLASYFRAPTLLKRFPHPDTWMHWVMHPTGRAVLVVVDPISHEFLVHFQLPADARIEDIDFGARLEQIVGERIPYEILSQAEWRAGVGLVAEHYGRGRCFLCGDAIHLFSPTGGLGSNTGIEDAFNLGWKLALVCRGSANPSLLETYEIERRPIGLRNTAYALQLAAANGRCPVSPSLDADNAEGETARAATVRHLSTFAWKEFDTPGIQLGARYDQSPLTIGGGVDIPADSPTEYIPTGIPGGRLPHVWLADGKSLFDRLGQEFTLICFRTPFAATSWQDAAASLSVDLSVLQLQEPILENLVGAELVLVRPDQHIAWRGGASEVNPYKIMATVIGKKYDETGDPARNS